MIKQVCHGMPHCWDGFSGSDRDLLGNNRKETYKETTPISYSISNSTSLLELHNPKC